MEHPHARAGLAALLLLASSGLAGCGDTEGPAERDAGPSSSTSSTAAGADERPDTYNDEDNDGEKPEDG
jgi:hypothetical protein